MPTPTMADYDEEGEAGDAMSDIGWATSCCGVEASARVACCDFRISAAARPRKWGLRSATFVSKRTRLNTPGCASPRAGVGGTPPPPTAVLRNPLAGFQPPNPLTAAGLPQNRHSLPPSLFPGRNWNIFIFTFNLSFSYLQSLA